MVSKIVWTAVTLVACLGLRSVLCAQEAKAATMEEILQRLDANLSHYDTHVPSLFCDEHVVSQIRPGPRNQNIVTDSVFRLKRTLNSDQTTSLEESRDIRKVGGKTGTLDDLSGPTLLSGVFEGGLAVVSLSQAVCMSYSLQKVDKKRLTKPYLVQFATDLTAQNSARCLLQENSTGRVSIDAQTMQVTHLELTTPHHIIRPGDSDTAPVVGKRVLTVDYAPVVLSGETFWLPSSIMMRVVNGAGTFHGTEWLFQATYSNYHKLQVTSRIVPTSP